MKFTKFVIVVVKSQLLKNAKEVLISICHNVYLEMLEPQLHGV
jgi:hypothetical protein